jgi:hypothetical protein
VVFAEVPRLIRGALSTCSATAPIESGTHDELTARCGRYAELFAMRAAGYSDDVKPVS